MGTYLIYFYLSDLHTYCGDLTCTLFVDSFASTIVVGVQVEKDPNNFLAPFKIDPQNRVEAFIDYSAVPANL
jgi:hypothetical protein